MRGPSANVGRESGRSACTWVRDPVTGKEKQLSKTVYGGAKAADEVLRDLIGNRAPRTDGMGVSFGQLLDQ